MAFEYSCCDLCPYDSEYSTLSSTVCEGCDKLKAEKELLATIFGSLGDDASARQIIGAPCPKCCHSHHCEAVDEVGWDECEFFDPLPQVIREGGCI